MDPLREESLRSDKRLSIADPRRLGWGEPAGGEIGVIGLNGWTMFAARSQAYLVGR
jgi:hypothetical protein